MGLSEVQEKSITVDYTNEQTCTFTDLAKYDEHNNEITYTVDEVDVDGYTKSIEGLTVTNTIKKYKITTDVNGNGGTISGDGMDPYDEVTHGGTNEKDIVVKPQKGYKIKSVTVNGDEQPLPEDPTKEYTLEHFTDVEGDINVVVEFEYMAARVVVKYVDIDTNEEIYGQIVIDGMIGQNYATEDKLNEINEQYTNKYELVKVEGKAEGEMTEDETVVTYYYRKVKATITTKYLDEATGEEITESEIFEGYIGDEYETTEKKLEGYELVEEKMPSNSKGKIDGNDEVVYYYRRVKVESVDTSDINVMINIAIMIISLFGIIKVKKLVSNK